MKAHTRHILLLCSLFILPNLSATDATKSPLEHIHSIFVTGNGEVSATPDTAIVRFGMTAQNARASVAQSKVNEVVQKAIEAIEKIGVKRQSIHTVGISLTPIYTDKLLSSGGSKITAFRADNGIEVVADDIKLTGDIVDAAIAAGANEIQSVSFRLKDDQTQRSNALSLAAQDAKAKAEALARTLGFTLGNVLEVNESGSHSPIALQSPAPLFSGRYASAPTPVEPGQIQVEATVTVRYEIGAKTSP